MSTSKTSTADTQSSDAARAVVKSVGEREIHTERIFNAPRERVWKAITQPELIAQWWGRGNPLTVERMDVERGGHWRFVEHSGGQAHGFEGRFSEVTPPERVAMTFEWDGMPGHVSLQTMTLEPIDGGRTRMKVTVLFLTGEDRDGMVASGMEGGMNESYDALERVLGGLKD